MIKKILFTSVLLLMISSVTMAQSVSLVFGPLEGDEAGLIIAEGNETFELELWARTEPGIEIIIVYIPLSTNNQYIRGTLRAEGEFFYPLDIWDDIGFLDPDDDRVHNGYTVQSIMGIEDFPPRLPYPDHALNTNGEWMIIASFVMTTVPEVDFETHYDAFISGAQQCNGNIVLVDYDTGEIDIADIEFSFAPLLLTEPIGIDDDMDLPDDFALFHNYPNPFNAKTTIRYDLPRESDVKIEIFNILGAKIATLVEESKPAGSHTVTWDTKEAPSGVYLYKIQAGEYAESKRCVLLK